LVDLLTELETASGRDLGTWAQAWLTTAGVNTLRTALDTDSAGTILAASLTQTAPATHPQLRPQRVAAGGYGPGPHGTTTRLWGGELSIVGENTEIGFAVGRTHPGLILPNDGDLGYAKLRLDADSLAYAIGHVGEIADPLARAVVWGSLWDQTRDAEASARDWVETATRWLGRETSSSTLRTVLATLATALAFYVAPEDREALTGAAAERLEVLLDAAPAGSDRQLHLLRAFAGHARTTEQLARVEAILAGHAPLPGRPIDTDLGWALLDVLVRAGLAGDERIGAALAADRSAAGQSWAARLRATVPTAAAKAEAWEQATANYSLANELQGATIAGFADVLDPGLVAGYAVPYFALLEETWAARSYEMASNVVEGLYPAQLAGHPGIDLLGLTDAWLEGLGDRTPALRRLVVEARAGAARSLAAQAFDRATR
jgi:aminopeptidase N